MSSSDTTSLSTEGSQIHYPPGSFRDRFSFSSDSRPPTPVDVNAPINPIFEKRIRRKVDGRLIPVLAVLFTIAFITTTNLAVVRREGADRDFNLLDDHRYYFVSLFFLLPFVLFQLPLILAFRRAGSTLWLGTTTFLFGALEITSGFVSSWGQFLSVRLVLGILEAGFLPSCIYLISTWYKRSEMQIRITLFYSASVFFGSFGNILAFGLSKIHTKSLRGWRWILALEGLLAVFVSFYGYSAVLPFPDKSHTMHAPFLSRDEIHLMRQRVELDRKDYVPDGLDKAKIYAYLIEVKLWLYAILALCANTAVYSSPSFLQESLPDGLSDAEVQLLSIPIGVVASLVVILTGFTGNRIGAIGPFMVTCFVLSTVGLSMLFSGRRGVRLAGCFLTYSGAQANMAMILTLQAMNVRQHSKRLFTVSFVASFAGIGALLSVVAFPVSSAPGFRTGLRINLALQAAAAVLVGLLSLRLRYENKRAQGSQLVGEELCAPGQEAGRRESDQNMQAGSEIAQSPQRQRVRRPRSIEGMVGFRYIA